MLLLLLVLLLLLLVLLLLLRQLRRLVLLLCDEITELLLLTLLPGRVNCIQMSILLEHDITHNGVASGDCAVHRKACRLAFDTLHWHRNGVHNHNVTIGISDTNWGGLRQ